MPELPFEYIRQSLFFFRSHFAMVVRIQLPFLLLINVLALMLVPEQDSGTDTPMFSNAVAALSLLNIALMPIYMAATITYFGAVIQNRTLTAGQALMLGLGRWRPLLLVYILSAFAIFSGLLFLIVPGIFILIRLAFADYICVSEGRGALDALKQSWERTDEYFWPLLNGLAIIFMVITGAEIGLDLLLHKAEVSDGLLGAASNILFGLLNTLLTVYGFRLYCVAQQKA